MHGYLGAIWKCRFFWLSLVKMDLRSRYRGSVLGIGWSLLQPIAMTTILVAVFRVALGAEDYWTFAPFVFIGMTFWGYVSSALLQGCGSFFQGESYIRQFPAPMAIYPLRTTLGSAFHFSIGLALAIAVAVSFGPDLTVNPAATRTLQLLTLPSLVPTLLLFLLAGWSSAILFGLLSVRFRDTRHLTEIGLQGLFYMTPILIDPRKLGPRRLAMVLECNPLTPFLNLLREPILYGRVPSLTMYATATVLVLILGVMAMLALKVEERRLIFHL